MEKNKNALTDEIKTKINYTISYLLENGERSCRDMEPQQVVYSIENSKGKALSYNIFKDGSLCLVAWLDNQVIVYIVKGAKVYQDPEGVIEVAEELGVFDGWEED